MKISAIGILMVTTGLVILAGQSAPDARSRANTHTVAIYKTKYLLVASENETLTTEEHKKLFVGNTLRGYAYQSAATFDVYYDPDGKAFAKFSTWSDEGVWRFIEDGSMCVKWKRIRGGREGCFRIRRKGKSYEGLDSTGNAYVKFDRVGPNKRF